MARLLVIDDEDPILESLDMFLSEKGHEVATAASAEQGIEVFERYRPEIVILDIRLPDRSGFEVLDFLNSDPRPPKVIMITAYHDMETTITSMKSGACDYIHKPLDPDEIEGAVNKALRLLAAEGECSSALPQKESDGEEVIIGKSKGVLDIFKMIGVLCRNRATVLVQGETGTGKELIARVIHRNSFGGRQPLITVDCSAVVETLWESEMFGHEKGAFTGATQTKLGKIELAGDGTLFLDEIGELPLNLQGKFLGFLERREFMRVGGQTPHRSKSRIIAATNRNLNQMVQLGTFREDLFYRLRVVTLAVPPLRERLEDIPDLACYFLQRINQDLGASFAKFQDGVITRLMTWHWPGNIRELKNVILAAAVRSRGSVILKEDVEKVLTLCQHDNHKAPGAKPALSQMEHQHILRILQQVDWNRTRAAELLGISLPTLRKKIRKYNISPDEE